LVALIGGRVVVIGEGNGSRSEIGTDGTDAGNAADGVFDVGYAVLTSHSLHR
jgi:hypothetical protein